MSNTQVRLGGLRTRWAAVGAAVAITIGAAGLGGTNVTQAVISESFGNSVFVPLDSPCRLMDTRDASTVGPRDKGLGVGETLAIAGQGTNGNCELPAQSTSLELNVTAIGATEITNLRFFPAGQSLPTTSNLNPRPGAPPTPNSVTVALSFDGMFNIYNEMGTVDVIVDVVGYYADHNHDADYFTKEASTQIAFGIADGPITIAEADGPTTIATANLVFLGQGTIAANASVTYNSTSSGPVVTCSITDGATSVAASAATFNSLEALAITAGFSAVNPVSPSPINLVCEAAGGEVNLLNASVTAIYAPLANFGE